MRNDRLLAVLVEQRELLRRHLLAAAVSPGCAEDVLREALAEVDDDAGSPGAVGGLLVAAVDAICRREAVFLKHPYRALLAALGRQWAGIQARLTRSGVSRASGDLLLLGVIRSFSDAGWEPATRQSLDARLIRGVELECAERAELRSRCGQVVEMFTCLVERVKIEQDRAGFEEGRYFRAS
jgi:hypothetical protein